MILFVAGIPPKYNPESKAIKKVEIENRRNNMTNFEKYKDEILALTEKGKIFALLDDNKIYACSKVDDCSRCKFSKSENGCLVETMKWLYQEARPTLTTKERGFCEIIGQGYIARDKDSNLHFFKKSPNKKKGYWDTLIGEILQINNTHFPFITHEDTEPWSIEDLLNLEVE